MGGLIGVTGFTRGNDTGGNSTFIEDDMQRFGKSRRFLVKK